MSKTIYDYLEGRPQTLENLRALQKDPRSSGLSPKYDATYSATVEDALKEIYKQDDRSNLSIPKSQSRALNMAADDELTFGFICRAKQDVRYSGQPCQRDPAYCKAIAVACEELGKLQEQKNKAAESEGTLLK